VRHDNGLTARTNSSVALVDTAQPSPPPPIYKYKAKFLAEFVSTESESSSVHIFESIHVQKGVINGHVVRHKPMGKESSRPMNA